LSTTDVASHWHEHFKTEVGDSDESIKIQAVCFFQLAQGAGLGSLVVGRRGAPTRFSFSVPALATFVGKPSPASPKAAESDLEKEYTEGEQVATTTAEAAEKPPTSTPPNMQPQGTKGRGIFIAHGKNKKPLEQLKKILEQFKIPYKVAIDEPNLGRPISGKIRDTMESCNCAILLFTADEEFMDKNGATIWRPSENVVYELGAAGYLYDNRIVIMKEQGVTFPSNFRDLGYISFEEDQIEAKAMDVLKELIGFGMVKVST
jgi:predicted nucleotide-binding protein